MVYENVNENLWLHTSGSWFWLQTWVRMRPNN